MTLINVTQADIDEGTACSCMSCPVKLAIDRAVKPPIVCVGVHATVAAFLNRAFGEWITKRVPLPQSAIDFIATFDGSLEGRKRVRPFTFELEI